ncbi:E3 ubiquitin-protein ligase TRIM47 [Geospiza fortis]|uniref:E3 ubiquitin-protein ligase TRIM47 n=1 Tax=Geospiza fortis TaxID=48883 RepID=A0A8N5I0H4_GEOFO|nr:E3 ubiquitin-protein ligase TRIM47 [Geospiza fortis]
MASAMSQKLEEKLVCSICLELFRVPVTLPCGHNFCKRCISDHWDKKRQEPEPSITCPECRRAFERRPELEKNVTLHGVVELARDSEERGCAAGPSGAAPAELCPRHGRALGLDLSCPSIPTVPPPDAPTTFLKESLEKAREESERIEQTMKELELQTERIKDCSELKDGIQSKFAHLKKALEDFQRQTVARIEQEQRAALEGVDKNWNLYPVHAQELAVKAVAPLPKCQLRAELLKDHRNLTFDPETANKYLEVSKGAHKAKHRPGSVPGQGQGPRFQPWQVLCTQSYGPGHHYWEVKISSHSVILGVTYRGLPQEQQQGHRFNIGLDGGSWGLQVREDCYLAWHEGRAQKIQEQLYKNLGVSLDYGKGLLSFYGLGERTKLIHSFHSVFTEPLYPVFWLWIMVGEGIPGCNAAHAFHHRIDFSEVFIKPLGKWHKRLTRALPYVSEIGPGRGRLDGLHRCSKPQSLTLLKNIPGSLEIRMGVGTLPQESIHSHAMPRILRGQKPVACCNLCSILHPKRQEHRKLQRPEKRLGKLPDVRGTQQIRGYHPESLHCLLGAKAVLRNLILQFLKSPARQSPRASPAAPPPLGGLRTTGPVPEGCAPGVAHSQERGHSIIPSVKLLRKQSTQLLTLARVKHHGRAHRELTSPGPHKQVDQRGVRHREPPIGKEAPPHRKNLVLVIIPIPHHGNSGTQPQQFRPVRVLGSPSPPAGPSYQGSPTEQAQEKGAGQGRDLSGETKGAQQAKFLSDAENELEELAVTITQAKKMVELIKGAATKERERVEKLFAEASEVLAAFQKEVLGFIEDGERSMLGEAEADLRWKEQRRAKLAQCKQSLENVPSTDTIYFLQEFQALKAAMEENLSPPLSFQKELNFTKCTQAVGAMKDVLSTACKNQWNHLRGKGVDGLNCQEMEEALAESRFPDKSNNAACLESRDYFLKFAFIIDLDSDTADKFIQLFGTKGAKRVLCPIPYPESPTRFINCEQVLGLNLMNRGNYYWEVELIDGWVSIGVIAEDFDPREAYSHGRLGRNDSSCCLQWNGQNYVAWFGGFECPIQQPFFHTIGVFLEYSEKALTFYGVKDSKMTCLQQLKVSPSAKGKLDPFQNKINRQFASLFSCKLKPAFFLESVDAHLQIGPLKKDCVSVLKRR